MTKGAIDLGGNCPGGELSRGELVGGNCPGGIVRGGTDLEPKDGNVGVCSTVEERETHMRLYAGSSPTKVDHREGFI